MPQSSNLVSDRKSQTLQLLNYLENAFEHSFCKVRDLNPQHQMADQCLHVEGTEARPLESSKIGACGGNVGDDGFLLQAAAVFNYSSFSKPNVCNLVLSKRIHLFRLKILNIPVFRTSVPPVNSEAPTVCFCWVEGITLYNNRGNFLLKTFSFSFFRNSESVWATLVPPYFSALGQIYYKALVTTVLKGGCRLSAGTKPLRGTRVAKTTYDSRATFTRGQ